MRRAKRAYYCLVIFNRVIDDRNTDSKDVPTVVLKSIHWFFFKYQNLELQQPLEFQLLRRRHSNKFIRKNGGFHAAYGLACILPHLYFPFLLLHYIYTFSLSLLPTLFPYPIHPVFIQGYACVCVCGGGGGGGGGGGIYRPTTWNKS